MKQFLTYILAACFLFGAVSCEKTPEPGQGKPSGSLTLKDVDLHSEVSSISATTVTFDYSVNLDAVANMPLELMLRYSVSASFPTEATEVVKLKKNETSATLTEMEDIPAGEGAILAQGTYTLNIAKATSGWSANMLEGSNVNTYVKGEAYVLANGTKGVGLYKAKLNKDETGDEGNTHFLNNANKAYLPVAVAGARFLGFDFGTETGIGEVETESENAVIYDLAGRRVQGAQKGIFIVNGKKVVK